jgi:hypothetical protein
MPPLPVNPTLAVFAADKGPGDAERAAIMSQAGTVMARHGARIVVLAEVELDCIPLVQAARIAGGDVLILADTGFVAPTALVDVPVERIEDAEARLKRAHDLAHALVGLPGSLASAAALYRCWQRGGGGAAGKPVVLLNHHRAFESLRGFAADIISHSVNHADRIVCFTDSMDDLWNKIAWALQHPSA